MLQLNKPKEEFLARETEFPDIAEIIKNKIISEQNKNYACNSLWASECGHDCTRYLVYQQCNWEQAKPTDEELLLVFNEGGNQEKQLLFDLQKAGIKIKDLQINIKIAEANISGKLDCVAICENNNGESAFLPVEIKSMSDIVFNSVNTVEDFAKYAWTRKYYAQMQCYLKNDLWFYPEGYFLAKNKSTGKIKLIKDFDGGNTIKFNENYWKELIKRGKEVKKYVLKNKTIQMQIESIKDSDLPEEEKQLEIEAFESQYSYPDRIKYDLKVCKGCKYEHICITELSSSIGNYIENESIIEAIDDYIFSGKEREKYKEAEKKYKNSLNTLKELFPLEDKLYFTEKYMLQTKIKKIKDNQYLSFEVAKVDAK